MSTIINIPTGLKEYDLNGAITIRINPTDTAFVERMYHTFTALDQKQDQYKAEIEAAKNKAEIFDVARARDKEMRDMLTDLFGVDVCTPLFGGQNVYALADGLPLWTNVLLAMMDEIDSGYAAEQKRMNPRVKKYADKWSKRVS